MNINKIIIKSISTFFYVGYSPLPGTAASLVGALLFYLMKGSILIYAIITVLFILLGLLVSSKAEEIFNKKDANYIVIDELSGMLLSLAFVRYDIKLIIIAFCLFRILDSLKPWPAHQLEKMRGSMGIMSDDIVAGLYTNIILQVVLRLASFRIS